MPRPLMQLGVGQLEELFAKSKADSKVLKQLEHELQYRQVPRAVALLAEVQAAMYGARDAGAPVPAATPAVPPSPLPRQPGLWEQPPATPVPTLVAAKPAHAPAPTAAPTPVGTGNQVPRAIQAMTIEDACKVLKTTPSATWESIEQTRRQLVQQSHPERVASMSPAGREQAQSNARLVNAAYATLSHARGTRR